MGKKRRNYPNLEELLSRPWCYYCERDFEDLKLLISHQKAKHYKCDRCGRRLNTAGGLSVHMNQVHKETLSQVENALEGREGLDVEIFGMEGVPEATMLVHNQQIIDSYQRNRADRQATTGNPTPDGESGGGLHRPLKKLRIESTDEIKRRLAEYRAQEGARKAAAAAAASAPPALSSASATPAASASTSIPASASLPTRPPGLPGLPGSLAGGSGLPGRPSTIPRLPPYGNGNSASTLDDLVSGAADAAGGSSAGAGADDIDKMIRMAEAGIKPHGAAAAAAAAPEKEKKKEKAMRMVYADGDFSLEEKMALIPRYAVVV